MVSRETYAGWECLCLQNATFELKVTLSVGPRVIFFGRPGGENLFYVNPKHRGLVGGADYRSYGGHRFLLAPEIPAITHDPDNGEVGYEHDGDWHHFSPSGTQVGLQKRLAIRLLDDSVELNHGVTNVGPREQSVAPWTLSVMAAGGQCIWPMPTPDPEGVRTLLPGGALALWHYTDLGDPRWSFSRYLGRLTQTPEKTHQKVGAFVPDGIVAYQTGGHLFTTEFPVITWDRYQDYGSNFQTFTREDMLEVETLGPLATLKTGDSTDFTIRWRLHDLVLSPNDEEARRQLLALRNGN